MDLSLVLVLTIVADLLVLKIIPARRRVARFVCMSVFFALQTVLIVALIGSPLRPTFRPKDLPREFWLQILTCVWWVPGCTRACRRSCITRSAAQDDDREQVIAACIYVCSALARIRRSATIMRTRTK